MREDSFSGLPFSPELVPLVGHIAIKENYYYWITILAYRLLAHLQFTSLLELDYINPICCLLSQGKVPIELTPQQKIDALRIYCDEGGHALFVEELACQLKQNFAVRQRVLTRPKFADTLDRIIEENQTNLSPRLIQLFFVTISETLITQTLSLIPKDLRVAAVVRSVIFDHAADEALHCAYFRGLFPLLWDSLNLVEQESIGRLLPQLVWTFLAPDRELEQNILVQGLGFHQVDAQNIMEETYSPQQVIESVQFGSRHTLKMFESAGVFTIPRVQDAFISSQLYS